MSYYTQNQIDELDKSFKKINKFKRIKWIVNIKNPITNEIIKAGKYCSLQDIHKDNEFLNYDTWRNIAVGRSKVYDPFIIIEKDMERDLFYCNNINDGHVDEQPTNIEVA